LYENLKDGGMQMRELAPSEILSLRELMQMETNALAKTKAIQPMVKDAELKRLVEAAILSSEATIRGMQQFITENQIIDAGEVH